MDASITARGGINGELNVSENVATLNGKIGTNSVQLSGKSYLPPYIAGTYNYEELDNKPKIESVELVGDKTFEQLGLEPMDADDLLEILG